MKGRKLIFRILTAMLAAMYLVSLAGLDVHSCLRSGKTYVVFLSRSLDCGEIHPDHRCGHDCSHGHGSCCECAEHVSELMMRLSDHHVRSDEGFNPGGCSCCHDESHMLAINTDTAQRDEFDFNYLHIAQPLSAAYGISGQLSCCHHSNCTYHSGNRAPALETGPDILDENCILRI